MSSKHNIMLEAGTNEFEILVFRVRGRRCGVNVAKVREVIDPLPMTRLPQTHPSMMGMFQLRKETLPLIDLCHCLGGDEADPKTGEIIIMEYNNSRVAFRVDAVEYIHRIKVSDVESLPNVQGLSEAPVTFVAHIDGDIVLMIDFEKLLFDIAGIDTFDGHEVTENHKAVRSQRHIWLAEDSGMIRRLISSNLITAGYTNLRTFVDGLSAWEALEAAANANNSEAISLIITDIEMPKMDGLHLTKRIKEHPVLKNIPVVIFSSLVSADNQKKGKQVGADAQITKPEIDNLVSLLDSLLDHTNEPAMA